MPDRKLRVFICHSSQDKPIVRELYQNLLTEGWIDPWLDVKKLLPGQDWRTEIEQAVDAADIIVICLSNNSVDKEGFIQKELRYAREIALEKPDNTLFLIPLRLEICEVPRGLRFFQWVDYFGNDKNQNYRDLLESLDIRYGQVIRREEEKKHKDMEERERREKEEKEREEIEERAKRESEELIRKQAEEMALRESEEKVRIEVEERARKEAEARERLLAEELARKKEEEQVQLKELEQLKKAASVKTQKAIAQRKRQKVDSRTVQKLPRRQFNSVAQEISEEESIDDNADVFFPTWKIELSQNNDFERSDKFWWGLIWAIIILSLACPLLRLLGN
jgi:hypothetical protein